MNLVDSHSHVYLEEFDPDRAQMFERAEKEGVVKILMPAIDSVTHELMLKTEAEYPNMCMSMMGLHPCSVKLDPGPELQVARDWLTKRSFVAIGETGLDHYWDLTYKDQQARAFNEQIDWALQYDIPVVIHSRNAIDACIEVIKDRQKGKLKGVFHCFSGNLQQAQQIIDLGFYMGIGGVITFKNSGLDEVIRQTGIGNVVLETDAPYLAPVPFRGKRNECSYLKYVVEKLSNVIQQSPNEIAKLTGVNAERLFGKMIGVG